MAMNMDDHCEIRKRYVLPREDSTGGGVEDRGGGIQKELGSMMEEIGWRRFESHLKTRTV